MGVPTVATAILAVCAGMAANNLMLRKAKPYLYSKVAASSMFLILSLLCWLETGNALWFTMLPGYVLCAAGDILLPLSGEMRPSAELPKKAKPSRYSSYKKKHEEPAEPVYHMPPLKNPWFNLGVGAFALAHAVFVLQFGSLLGWKISPLWFAGSVVTMLITVVTGRSSQYDYQGHKPVCTVYSLFVGYLGGMGIDLLMQHFGGNGAFGAEGYLMLASGAICFVISDLLLAMTYFKKKIWWMTGFVVMLFYYGAMYFLTAFTLYL